MQNTHMAFNYKEVFIASLWTFPGFAAAAFMTINGMEILLSHKYFETENRTEMFSDVITATLPAMNNTNLTEPVNFTIQHKKVLLNPSTHLYFLRQTHFFKTKTFFF